jgi:DNA helicase TIP49 (TBP-interacting protein)
VERDSGTFCFTDAGALDADNGTKKEGIDKILVFSHEPYNREKASKIIRRMVREIKVKLFHTYCNEKHNLTHLFVFFVTLVYIDRGS